jgi:UDP-N-acetylmuramate dehydrogenase
MELTQDGFASDVPLQALNTFGIVTSARHLAAPTDLVQLQALLASPIWRTAPRRLILGGGSNLLFTQDFDGAVIAPCLRGVRILPSSDDAWLVEVAAGENWHDTVSALLAQDLPGLENLALIPGTAGAAPIQNIGAYGLELKERFAWLDAVEIATGDVKRFDAAACAFGYRDSVFKQDAADRYVIVSVTFALPKQWQPVIAYADVAAGLKQRGIENPTGRDVFDVVVDTRRAKLPDPAQIGNAGSFFKNPVVDAAFAAQLKATHPTLPVYLQTSGQFKLAAAWLIDQCGFKGARRGAAGVHDKQALVLVNHGGATGAQILALAHEIQAGVSQRFGVALEPEPIIV